MQRVTGLWAPAAVPQRDAKTAGPSNNSTVVVMDAERIQLAEIKVRRVGPSTIARRLAVPGTVVPDAGRVAHVSAKLSGKVAELRKNIGDDVVNPVIAVETLRRRRSDRQFTVPWARGGKVECGGAAVPLHG